MTNEELAGRVRNGRKEFCLDLWKQTERFIGQQAGIYFRSLDGCRGVTEEDLKQAGYIALMDAADQYDPDRGASFIHYLTFHLHKAFVEAAGLRTEREQRDPISAAISLDQPLSEDAEETLGDVQPDQETGYTDAEDRLFHGQLRETLRKALDEIPPDCAEAIRLRYISGMKLKEAAEALGVSLSMVRQREAKGLRILRARCKRYALEEYFIEIRTPYYRQPNFRTTLTSAVEANVLLREELRKRYRSKEHGQEPSSLR